MQWKKNKKISFLIDLKSFVRSFFAQEFFRNPLVHWTLIGTLFANIASWAILAAFIRPIDFLIILHYNVYFGVDLVGAWWQAYILPAMGAFFWIVNFILALVFFRRKERIASHIFLLASFIIQVAIIIAEVAIVLINY